MVKKKEADIKEEKKETNMNIQLITLLLVSAFVGGAGLYGGYQVASMGIITPKPKLSVASIACEERLYRNASSFEDYEAIRTKGGCDMYAPYAEAYPKAKVALKVEPMTSDIQEGETTPVGKP